MNRKVLITGASRGIGKEIAISFAKEKDELYLTCKSNIDELEKLSRELEKEYGIICHASVLPEIPLRYFTICVTDIFGGADTKQ